MQSATIPANVQARLTILINLRDAKMQERRDFTDYNGYDDFYKRQSDAQRAALDRSVKELTEQIIGTGRKYLNIVVRTDDDESTIANIVAALPEKGTLRPITYIDARGHSPT